MKASLVFCGVLASLALASPSKLESRQSSAYSDYLFVYFTGEGKADGEQIYMSVSNNNNPGSWTQLNGGQKILTSNVGTAGVRDPSIIRSADGKKFWIIATDLRVYPQGWGVDYTKNGSKGIVVWESTNLKNWDGPYLRTVSPSNAGMTWAPDAIYDPSTGKYLVFWTTSLANDGWYIMKSYTSDFKTFSTAEKFLTGAGMDATIALDKSTNTFYRISKNGPNELIEQAKATSLNGQWTVVKQQIGQGLPAGEGPLIFQNNANPSKVRVIPSCQETGVKANNKSSKWHLFIDDYTRGRGYAPYETTNIASGNWVASSGFTLPPGNRHGYVIGITAAERACLVGSGPCGTGSGTTTTAAPPTSTTPVGSCSAKWAQCGGIGWTGATCCSEGKCTYSNDWYSQCL
ncbi:hypothetical protein jhhlp_004998 [Lomentospora prolificans]|uniref:CBM1 domain-containing protein n=1 Tax=Lomentospora prolificans TaxID=41688 RepID=A0A2N3N8C9_9PEZI|nr:hypothetical protein jhhlp_004998 [Lomentospora prolificans]